MALDFGCSVPYALDPRIPPEAFKRVVAHKAHAAMDLNGRIGHTRQHLTGIELGGGNLAVGRQRLI